MISQLMVICLDIRSKGMVHALYVKLVPIRFSWLGVRKMFTWGIEGSYRETILGEGGKRLSMVTQKKVLHLRF